MQTTHALRIQVNVLGALMLRDMQTRFGGSYINYVIALGWPLVHTAILLLIYTFMGRQAPVGTSVTMFFATGLIPYMFFNYPARWMMTSVLMNHPLLGFPIVKALDLMIARALLETIAGCCVILVTGFVLFALGNDVLPRDPIIALESLAAMSVLAIGVGFINAVLVQLFKPWMVGFILVTILLYMTSGVVFVTSALPEKAQKLLYWNPVLHGVEHFRTAYYDGIGTADIPDLRYPVIVGLICIVTALVFERFVMLRITPS